MDYPIATVDIVLCTVVEEKLQLILHKRANEPFKDIYTLPGGFIHKNEDENALAAAKRVLKQKLGITPKYIEQLYTFSGIARDPRGWSISIVYLALMPYSQVCDAKNIIFTDINKESSYPFDHQNIVEHAKERIQNKSSYSSLPFALLPEMFTISELHKMYQIILNTKIDIASFRRKILDQKMIEEAGHKHGVHRPAILYKMSDKQLKYFGRQTIV